MSNKTCPNCTKQTAQPVGNAFIEEGEYDGSSYELEGNATKYECGECGQTFYIMD